MELLFEDVIVVNQFTLKSDTNKSAFDKLVETKFARIKINLL